MEAQHARYGRSRFSLARATRWFVGAVALISLTAPLAPMRDALAAVNPPSTAQLQRDVSFRESFGFEVDPAYVASIIAHRSETAEISQPYGVFLTSAEQASMRARTLFDDAVQAPGFQHYLRLHRDEFGGMWADQAHGGLTTVLFTGHLPEHLQALEALFPAPGFLRVQKVTYTEDAIQATIHQIIANRGMLASVGVDVTSAVDDTIGNGVRVGVANSSLGTSLSVLQARYGSIVRETVPAPLLGLAGGKVACDAAGFDAPKCGYIEAPPFNGGQDIGDGQAICTSGFSVTYQGAAYLLTAGHCDVPGGSVWSQVNVPIGGDEDNQWVWGTDVMLIYIEAGSVAESPQIFAYVAGSPGTPVNFPITSAQGWNADYVGEPICQAGIHSTYVCGSELNHGGTYCFYEDYETTCENNLREGNYESQPGDSGGPNFWGSQAIGTTTGYTNANSCPLSAGNCMLFQQMYDDLHNTGASLLT